MTATRVSGVLIPGFLLLSLLSSGCSDNGKDSKVLSESKMVDVLTDLQIAEAYSYRGDPDKRKTTLGILAYHGVTQEEMDSTLAWYGRNIDEYRDLYKKVDRKLAATMSDITGTETDRSGELWIWPSMYRIQPDEYNDGLTFSIPMPSITPGTQVEFAYRSPRGETLEVLLGVEYGDGTTSFRMMNRAESRRQKILLQTDSAKQVNRLFGTLRLTSRPMQPVALDSVSLTALPMNPNDYYQINEQRTLQRPRRPVRKPETRDTVVLISGMPEPLRQE